MGKLKLYSITGDLNDLDRALQIFVELSCVYPVKSDEFINRVHGLTSISAENTYKGMYEEIEEIEQENSIDIKPHDYNGDIAKSDFKIKKDYCHTLHQSLTQQQLSIKDKTKLKNKYQDALTQVNSIMKLDVSLDDLFSCDYISIRFGKLPKDSLEILKIYDKKEIFFKLFEEEKNFYWCMYITVLKNKKEIDNIFSSLYFERIYISEFVHGTPENAIESMKKEIRQTEEELKKMKKELKELIALNIDELSKIKGYLLYNERINEAKKYVVGLGEKFNIKGFVSKNSVEEFQNSFKAIDNIEVDILPLHFDKRLKPPKDFKKKRK